MNKQKSLENIFPPAPLGENRTLFECDFYDTHYSYFDQIDDNYLSAIDMSSEDLILKYNFDIPEFYTIIGVKAAVSRTRPNEGIKIWKDVSYEYLYYFGSECCYLSSDGFKFFFPAALYHFLTAPKKNNAFMDSFIFRLDSRWEEDNHVFNDTQKIFIIEFVREYYKGYVSWISAL